MKRIISRRRPQSIVNGVAHVASRRTETTMKERLEYRLEWGSFFSWRRFCAGGAADISRLAPATGKPVVIAFAPWQGRRTRAGGRRNSHFSDSSSAPLPGRGMLGFAYRWFHRRLISIALSGQTAIRR